ncbi:MAG: hypothetical protein GY816_02220 [Cytophagales bacterium]|nr:hypothetical protein [Cytophagales bacterium]
MSIIKAVLIVSFIQLNYYSYSQINFEKHPSKWPDPFSMTMQQRIDTGYNHSKILDFLRWKKEWRMENLPKLYLFFDKEKERELGRYQYGGGWNYELSYAFPGDNLVYYVHDRPAKKKSGYIKLISEDSLKKMDIRDGAWVRKYFIENEITRSRCLALTEICSELFIVIQNPDGQGYLIMKPNNCIEEFE